MPIGKAASAFRVYVESSGRPGTAGSVQTGIALANPALVPVVAELELTKANGTPSGWRGSVTIPAGGQIARFLKELIPGSPDNLDGLLRLTTASPVFATGLRLTMNERGDYLMTATPPASETGDFTNEELVFPEIVFGGGFTTDIVIFNRQPGQSPSGTVRFVAKDGSPLPLP